MPIEQVTEEQRKAEEIHKLDERKFRDDISKWIEEGKNHHSTHFTEVEGFTKRYEAKRSISGFMGWGDDSQKNPKNSPWDNCSDIGIPLEAFTIEGLLPRFLKVCFGAKPIVWVRGRGELDMESAGTVQEALNFQLLSKIKIYRAMKLVYKSVPMCGDGIAKCVWEEDYKLVSKTKYFLYNPLTNEKILDPATQQPVEVDKDFQPQADESGFSPLVNMEILTERIKIYDSPKIYPRNIKNFIVPKDADTPDIQSLDWCADEYTRTIDWIKKRIGNPQEGGFSEGVVREIESDVQVKMFDRMSNPQFSKVLISEWHGKYDVNGDNFEEEVIAFLAQPFIEGTVDYKNAKLLGWMITPYPKRPFFHYFIIPKEGSFYNIGVPEFLIGIRNLIDAIFNQMIDRGSITNNPPILKPPNHDPSDAPFGPGVQWTTDNPGGYSVLELPKNEQMEFSKMEFLLGMVQKLFGVSDYSLGQDTGNQRTATGIMSIIGEGNVKFDDMIRALQDVNEELYEFIVDLNSELLTDEFVYRLTEDNQNPFKKVPGDKWGKAYDYEAVGNSVNINREIEQARAEKAYNTVMLSIGKNPTITADVIRTVTMNFFRSIDMRNVKIPSLEEVRQEQAKIMAMALQQLQEQQLSQTPKEQLPP